MSLIALIDTAIDKKYFGKKAFEHISLCGGLASKSSRQPNHGTMCAMVLDYCAADYELVNIQIFESDAGKAFTDVELLANAFGLCKDMSVDVVSLSAVSSILSDSKHLYHITRELAENTVIVSSLDNMGYVTVPTSYPHVVGVSADYSGLLDVGGLAFVGNDQLGVDVYANCDFGFLHEQGMGQSNSFAVPVVAAHINGLLNQSLSNNEIKRLIRSLPEYPTQSESEAEMPVVFLSGFTVGGCISFMDEFYDSFETQCTALSFLEGIYDVRIKQTRDELVQCDLHFMRQHYKTDMIFIVGNEWTLQAASNKIEIDVVIARLDDVYMSIAYDGEQEILPSSDTPSRLHEILTS